MKNCIYLDYPATTPLDPRVRAAMAPYLEEHFGNPHSEHGPSRRSEEALQHARAAALAYFDADPAVYDICFTANTSAAIKLALKGG